MLKRAPLSYVGVTRLWTAILIVVSVTAVSRAQQHAGLLSDTARFHAPLSAVGTTRVTEDGDGGRREFMSRTQLYRDSFGRVRLEISSGAGVVNSADTIVLLMPNPYAQTERLFLVDDVARTVEKTDFHTCARLFNASTAFSIPTARRRLTVYDVPDVHAAGDGYVDDLGERQLAGVTVRGVRFTSPTTKQVDERWESEELGLVIHARHTDPHVEIEYRVDNVERRDPPQRQFVLPADYALLSETYLLLDPPLWKRRY